MRRPGAGSSPAHYHLRAPCNFLSTNAGTNLRLPRPFAPKGNKKLRRLCPTITHIYGGEYDRVWQATDHVADGQMVAVGRLQLEVLHTPCHTVGSVMFWLRGRGDDGALFSGDALFCGGPHPI